MNTPGLSATLTWFCLRSQPKHEHIAALHLRSRIQGIDVFCPRLRVRKQTRRGAVWFVEPFFPGYLFAQFNPAEAMQTVKSTPGVTSIVSFGRLVPVISEETIKELRIDFDQNEMHEVTDHLKPGDGITIAAGPFQGLNASVIRVLPGPQRVQVLMNLLGRDTPVEVARSEIVGQAPFPQSLARTKVLADPGRELKVQAGAPLLPKGGVALMQQTSLQEPR